MKRGLAVFAFFVVVCTAKASTTTWVFENAQLYNFDFSEGGTITGSFDYNADTGTSSNVDVVNSFSGNYVTVTQISSTTYQLGGGNGIPLDMIFSTDNALTDAGGTLTFTGGWDNNFSLETFNGTLVGTPDVAPTPEPSSFALLGTGLVGLGGVLRRRLA